jgi:hypothetical protein
MLGTKNVAFAEIDRQHREVLAACDHLTSLSRSAENVGEIASLRMRLAGLLQANLTLEEREIFSPLRTRQTADRPRLFEEIEVQAADLRRRYSEHIRLWNAVAIQQAPGAYAAGAAKLIRDVGDHLKLKRSVFPEWMRILTTNKALA